MIPFSINTWHLHLSAICDRGSSLILKSYFQSSNNIDHKLPLKAYKGINDKMKSNDINNTRVNKISPDYVTLFAVSLAVFLGGIFRLSPVLLSDFPLNDGGLFYQMTKDIIEHNFSLPFFTSYNGSGIIFAYPPFTFYLMALIQRSLKIDIIDQLQFLPVFFSILCIPAFYFLSRSMTGSKERSIFAVLAFALMPRSYQWLVMGGGITRSIGLFFAILSILSVWEMFRKPKILSLLLSILFCSLTILSHPETAWFVFFTSLLIGITYGMNKKGILFATLTLLCVLILTSPWWTEIIQRFGLSVLINAMQSGFFSISMALFDFSGEPFITILAAVALFGIFAELVRRRYFLLVWMILIVILSPRSGATFATLPASMLFGSGVVWVLIPGLVSITKRSSEDNIPIAQIIQERISKFALAVVLIYVLFSSYVLPYLGSAIIFALSQDDREAMEWASSNTKSSSSFVVLTGNSGWETDPISEWFPALSKRISVSTVQGSEWILDDQFTTHIERHINLQSCGNKDLSCVITWSTNNNISFSYIYLNKPKAGDETIDLPITHSLMTSEHLLLIFDNPRASIYQMIENP